MPTSRRSALAFMLTALRAVAAQAQGTVAQGPQVLPAYLDDRGEGVATSMFGTYVSRGEWIVYPFFEYYRDDDFEYKPEELGYPGEVDYLGRYRAREGLLFLAYGLRENLAIEVEAAVISASFEKAADDPSGVPSRLAESGLGDIEGQIR